MLATSRHRAPALIAFCFGVAFSLSAFANDVCQDCWDACFADRDACLAAGYPTGACVANFHTCALRCGCVIP